MPGFESQLDGSCTAVIGQDPAAMLANVLEQARFWPQLDATLASAGAFPHDLRILILPDLEFSSPDAPTYTEPRFVDRVMDLQHDRGY